MFTNFILWSKHYFYKESFYVVKVGNLLSQNTHPNRTNDNYRKQARHPYILIIYSKKTMQDFQLMLLGCTWKVSSPSPVLGKDDVTCSSTESCTKYHKPNWLSFPGRGLMSRILFIILTTHVLSQNICKNSSYSLCYLKFCWKIPGLNVSSKLMISI